MRLFRRRRKPRPLVPGELIHTSTIERRARFYEVSQYVLDERDEWYREHA